MFFCCPKCRGQLNIDDAVARCERGHAFDRAKEGYYNLLLGAGGGTHGDNREMVRARRDFLSRGYYEPLGRTLGEMLSGRVISPAVVLDAGCGEGYYTDLVQREICERGRGTCQFLAFDISKDAVKYASKRNKDVSYAVASSYDIPLPTGSVGCVMNVFSPMAMNETARVLAPGGYFLFVYPAEEHLWSLKAAIYDSPYKNEPRDNALDGFELIERREVFYEMSLERQEDVKALFMMTPYAYRTGSRELERLGKIDSLCCEARFIVTLYKKTGTPVLEKINTDG